MGHLRVLPSPFFVFVWDVNGIVQLSVELNCFRLVSEFKVENIKNLQKKTTLKKVRVFLNMIRMK